MEKIALCLITFLSLSRAIVQNCDMICGGTGGGVAVQPPTVVVPVQPGVGTGGSSSNLQCNCGPATGGSVGGGTPGIVGGGTPGIVGGSNVPGGGQPGVPTTPLVPAVVPPTPPPVAPPVVPVVTSVTPPPPPPPIPSISYFTSLKTTDTSDCSQTTLLECTSSSVILTETLSSTVYVTPPTPPPAPVTPVVTQPVVTVPPTPVVTVPHPPVTPVTPGGVPVIGGNTGGFVGGNVKPVIGGGSIGGGSVGGGSQSTVCEVNCDVPARPMPRPVQQVPIQPAVPQVIQQVSTPVEISTATGMGGAVAGIGGKECICEPSTSNAAMTRPSVGNINCADKTNSDIQACETGPVMLTTNVAGVETPVAPSYVAGSQLSYTTGQQTCTC